MFGIKSVPYYLQLTGTSDDGAAGYFISTAKSKLNKTDLNGKKINDTKDKRGYILFLD